MAIACWTPQSVPDQLVRGVYEGFSRQSGPYGRRTAPEEMPQFKLDNDSYYLQLLVFPSATLEFHQSFRHIWTKILLPRFEWPTKSVYTVDHRAVRINTMVRRPLRHSSKYRSREKCLLFSIHCWLFSSSLSDFQLQDITSSSNYPYLVMCSPFIHTLVATTLTLFVFQIAGDQTAARANYSLPFLSTVEHSLFSKREFSPQDACIGPVPNASKPCGLLVTCEGLFRHFLASLSFSFIMDFPSATLVTL
jgi:hypothetical protein